MRLYLCALLLVFSLKATHAQEYWQQAVDYTMEVEVDAQNFQYQGTQKLIYTNNSPETLHKVFYHLYYNAFQPGSEMAIRVKKGSDTNTRIRVDIDALKPNEIGYLKVQNLKQDGVSIVPELSGTILEVPLNRPLGPGDQTILTLDFQGQVPKMVRRAGRESAEGVALSMAQWYPKMAEYDYEGWNAEPYLGREFHGVWGNFDVTLLIDKDYTVAASGYLQEPEKVGHGYAENAKSKVRKGKIKWRFIAPRVHDFTWAADPEYIHDRYPGPDGVQLHFFYKNDPKIKENWKKLQPKTAELMQFYNENIGPYPYKQYSVVQGGDGGMEYAMLTLITGTRKFGSLFGVTAHELAHSWFQHVLATNEMKHEWMDEGFTSYISTIAEDIILEENKRFPLEGSYRGYYYLATSGVEEPMATNANRYAYNLAYERAAYSKGAVFLGQLGYVIGQKQLAESLKAYYDQFKFKHPSPNDFRRVAERVSGLQLRWYLTDWTQTTNRIDYGIEKVVAAAQGTQVQLKRYGAMPMPLDILVVLKDGSQQIHHISIPLLRGTKENPYAINWKIHPDWSWANPDYILELDTPKEAIDTIIIDPSMYMADLNRENNSYSATSSSP